MNESDGTVDPSADAQTPPAWVVWRGARRAVITIEGERRRAGRWDLRVRLDSGETLLLAYRADDAVWAMTPVGPPFHGRA